MGIGLRMTAAQHAVLQSHLLPGDGKEAVAVALCGRRGGGPRQWLVVHKVVCIPHDQCARAPDRVTWPTDLLLPLLPEAERRNYAVLKVHSHPGGYPEFSEVDDASDRELFEAVHGCIDGELPHASAVIEPGGRMFGRAVHVGGAFEPLDAVSVVGDDIHFWYPPQPNDGVPEFAERHAQLFGKGTTEKLRRLRVAVVGCSGTGSPVVEQLARLGVGLLALVDHDVVEKRNLNRIVGSTMEDAECRRLKVDVLARSVKNIGLGTTVLPISKSLFDPEVIKAIAGCDAVFGCMDSVEGRHVLNRLATFYSMPYFDLGVKLEADGRGGVDYVGGVVHYLQPGRSSLKSRGVYTDKEVFSESLRRTDPAAYAERLKAKYITGVQEDRPAVISVNMQVAALAVNEFLARIHPYRDDVNDEFAVHRTVISRGEIYREPEGPPCAELAAFVGRGDMNPLLNIPSLGSNKGNA
jgi:hypothetical protein